MGKVIRKTGVIFLTALFSLTGLQAGASGCGLAGGDSDGSDDADSVGTGSGDPLQDAVTTLNSVLMVASTSLNVSAASLVVADGKGQTVDQHVHCPNGSQASVTGTNGAGLFDIQIVMNGCEGVTGSSGFSGTSATGVSTRDFTGNFTGSAGGNGCALSLVALGYSFSVPVDVITVPTSESVTGLLAAACVETDGDASVPCDFTAGVNAASASALASACTCSGDGCL